MFGSVNRDEARARPFRHHARYLKEHRIRRRAALLRRRLRLVRDGRRRGVAESLRATEGIAARPRRAAAGRRPGFPRFLKLPAPWREAVHPDSPRTFILAPHPRNPPLHP